MLTKDLVTIQPLLDMLMDMNKVGPLEKSLIQTDVIVMTSHSLSISTNIPHFARGEYEFVVNLHSQGYSGRCGLKKIQEGLVETHSSLDPELQNKGLDNGYRVCSALHRVMTIDAEFLWESKRLRQEYKILRGRNRFWVIV